MRILGTIKNRLIKFYNFIKELEQIPQRNFSDDFDSEAKPETPRAKRTNHVKVEDLRPPRKPE
ncbi:MAG: hypothetical protein ACKOX6_10665 [Bdellovibrio sp.]